MTANKTNGQLGQSRTPFPAQQDWRRHRLQKTLNTFSPKFSYRALLSRPRVQTIDSETDTASRGLFQRLINGIAARFRRWLPSIDEGLEWQFATNERRKPHFYVAMTPDVEYVAKEVLARSSSYSAPILDLGCSCGRALNRLHELGFKNLFGVDASGDALELGRKTFPDLYQAANIESDLMQAYFSRQPDLKYETVFTNGATVELVHPTFPLLREICRVTRDYVILNISENYHRYPRWWEFELSRYGFILVKLLRPIAQELAPDQRTSFDSMSLMVFQRVARD